MAGQHGGVILGRLPEGPNNGSCSSSWKGSAQNLYLTLPHHVGRSQSTEAGRRWTKCSALPPQPYIAGEIYMKSCAGSPVVYGC
nr:uncharacterized protein LOC129380638 isoform X4 [Dermacentor andersoni]